MVLEAYSTELKTKKTNKRGGTIFRIEEISVEEYKEFYKIFDYLDKVEQLDKKMNKIKGDFE